MKVEIKIPEVGESVQEAVLAQWFKSNGEKVEIDEPLFVIETDKVTLEIPSDVSGILSITVEEGESVSIGTVIGYIDTEMSEEAVPEKPAPEAATPEVPEKETLPEKLETADSLDDKVKKSAPLLSPAVRVLIKEKQIDINQIEGTGPGGRVTKGDVILYLEENKTDKKSVTPEKGAPKGPPPDSYEEEVIVRKPMSPIRQKIAEHLLNAKQNTAMLTTFNEIDMNRAMEIRTRYKEDFNKKYNIRLGFMSFFIKATIDALKMYPDINAFIDKKEIVYHEYYHIGVAIGTDRGLVVPVIKHADKLSFADTEKAIMDYVKKIKENKLSINDLEGGTFSITNGGVYGSLMSTPILNMPQSGILGMHKIEDRPVAVNGEVVIRPMMYVALSYDHRIVDGKAAVSFLKRIKECIETPERMMMEI